MLNTTTLSRYLSSGIAKFLFANALYSLTTAIISFLSPSLLENDVYVDFIYLFQMVLYLTGVFTVGLVPGLLRYYKLDNRKYEFYYYFTASLILIFLLILGLIPGNFISVALKIAPPSVHESLMIYLSVIFSLLFIFNRGAQTAKCNYEAILKDVVIIFIARIMMLICVKIFDISNPYVILSCFCVVPFIYELWVFVSSMIKINISKLDAYWDFVCFILKISITGIIFTSTNRLFIISSKSYNSSLAAALSFAAGMTGIITIFNTTFSSVFIGKLDHRNPEGVLHYIAKIKKYFIPFLFTTIILGICVFFVVTLIYPDNTVQAAIISAITVVHCALIAYVGLITLMTKTYNMLNIQILLNASAFIIVFLFVRFCSVVINKYVTYIAINAILLITEILLALIILKRVKKNIDIQLKQR